MIVPPPCCRICGADLQGRREGARYCCGACRIEASRLRRLLDGDDVGQYRSVYERLGVWGTRGAPRAARDDISVHKRRQGA